MTKPIDDLTEADATAELGRLAGEIARHDALYHQKDAPEISDGDYDALVIRNKAIEARFPGLVRADSPSRKVGHAPAAGFSKHRHLRPMLSLDNAFSAEDVQAFLARARKFLGLGDQDPLPLGAEPKIDGLSCSLTYRNGRLETAATRGDGEIGEDVTANARTIHDIPQMLAGDASTHPTLIEIRGEVYMARADFLQINKARQASGDDLYANPRNAAAGALRQVDPAETAKRPLRFFAYALGHVDGEEPATHAALLASLKSWGFEINPLSRSASGMADALALFDEVGLARAELPYDIDGVVYKVDDRKLQERLGFAGRSPRWAIAHKFPAERSITTLNAITIQIGRTGVLTPVAELDPITVGGVVIQRATLHNAGFIAENDIRVGDKVVVQRAGDVIPQIVEALVEQRPEGTEPYGFPTACPVCGSPATRLDGAAAIKCSGGFSCKAQAVGRLIHYAGRDYLNIDGMGEGIIQELVDDGILTSPVDFFKLPAMADDLARRDGWGKSSAAKLAASVEKARRVPFAKFVAALGIPQVGRTAGKDLAKKYLSIHDWRMAMERLIEGDPDARAELLSIDGIGGISVDAMAGWFADPENVAIVDGLIAAMDVEDHVPTASSGGALQGKTVVFTGTLVRMTREEAKAKAEAAGAKASGSVSKKTNFLVCGADAGSKAEKAKDLGVAILTEDEFLALVEGAA